MLSIYADPTHYDASQRQHLADVLRPYWKDSPLSDEKRREMYGHDVDRLVIVDRPDAADLCVLPMSWNFYYRSKQLDRALSFVARSRELRKPVVSWVTGDEGVTVPVDDVYVFRASGYASKRKPLQYAMPVIIRDPLSELGTDTLRVRRKETKPVVGFCGQAADPLWKRPLKLGAIAGRNLAYYAGIRYEEPQTLRVPTRFRARILNFLKQNPAVETRFIVRRKYRARGEGGSPDRARQQFLQNILETDYTLCVRGGGNFSKRFYEVLALGRIPVFVNTDCILPWDDMIDWKKYCVWVEEQDIRRIGTVVAEYHRTLLPDAFMQLQHEARRLWVEKLSFPGFFRTWVDFFSASSQSRRKFLELESQRVNIGKRVRVIVVQTCDIGSVILAFSEAGLSSNVEHTL